MELSIYENISPPSNTRIHDLSSNLYNSRDELTQVVWSWEEDKIFENSLAEFGIDSQLLLPSLALRLQSKSVLEIKKHFKVLVEDIRMIESGLVEIPNYEDRDYKLKASQAMIEGSQRKTKRSQSKNKACERPENGSTSRNRKKGIPWTKNEHKYVSEINILIYCSISYFLLLEL
ncbi:hypothetical protein L6164_016925 [Bauhinia variegata]|uniref:Uncharacterized protein n=1 Tax=Bauhinia variegata TaxID=167791 RepID=A0ACB9N7U7_BAUVA|nr:hypothetical protein L6164_016925 [Bauhinia variegata]